MISLPSTPQFQYSHDLFYIAPFYHLAFPNLDLLIATDLDIEFRYLKDFFPLYLFFCLRSNVEELYEEFQNFPEFALLGAAKDPTLRLVILKSIQISNSCDLASFQV